MNYDDIKNLKRPKSKYPKMSVNNRAAQFMPFAALEGFSESTKLSEIVYDSKISLSVDQINELNDKLKKCLIDKEEAIFVFFIPINDDLGFYEEINGIIKRIEEENIIFLNNEKRAVSNLIEIKDI